MKSKTLSEWESIFEELDVCVEPVLTSQEAIEHPHTIAREMIVDVPVDGSGKQKQVASPIKLSGHTANYKFTGTKLGTHSREILSSIGYNNADIEKLRSKGVIAT